jgi:hypothetical protein
MQEPDRHGGAADPIHHVLAISASGYFSRQHQKHRSEIEIGRRKNICEADPVPDLVGRTIGLVLVSGDGTSAHCTVDPKQRETFLRILRAQPLSGMAESLV